MSNSVRRNRPIRIMVNDEQFIKQLDRDSTKLQAQAIKQAIYDAVWNGEINQVTTREVADTFGCSLSAARRHLLNIVKEKSGDDRFGFCTNSMAVIVKDGRKFTRTTLDMQGNPIWSENQPIEYLWFLT